MPPHPVDPEEPSRVAETAGQLNLQYVVVTSVTRDDLFDGGAAHFGAVIHALKNEQTAKEKNDENQIQVEVLIPDFQGNKDALKTVVDARPDVINHNIETVASLYGKVRPEAQYQRSLDLLSHVKKLDPAMPTKSGIMVGLGETGPDLEQTIQDLFNHNCDILTIGQYLQPTREHLPVESYYSPEKFETLKKLARSIGFKQVSAGPFVRSSYQAKKLSGLQTN